MPVDLDQLRSDLRYTAAREGWSDAEIKAMGADIKAMIDRDDQEALAWQAEYFAWWRLMVAEVAGKRARTGGQ